MEVSYTPDEKRFCKDCRFFSESRCFHILNASLIDGSPYQSVENLRYKDQFSCGKTGIWWEAK